MRIGPLTVLVASWLLAGVGSFASADDRKEIEALYAKFVQAFKKKDVNAILETGTPDFAQKGVDGTVLNAKQVEAMMRQQFATIKAIKKMEVKIKEVKIKGKTATVLSSFTLVWEIVDKEGQLGTKGKTHTLTVLGTTRDTLVKTDKGWKFKLAENLSEKLLVDGKPLRPRQGTSSPKSKKR